MQKLLGICSKYIIDHSLTCNAKKSFSLCFIPGALKFDRPELYMDNLLIPYVSECMYLRKLVTLYIKRTVNVNMLLKRFSKC